MVLLTIKSKMKTNTSILIEFGHYDIVLITFENAHHVLMYCFMCIRVMQYPLLSDSHHMSMVQFTQNSTLSYSSSFVVHTQLTSIIILKPANYTLGLTPVAC